MPTIRSEYSIDQFREALQKLARITAMAAVEYLDQGNVRISIQGDRFSSVETSNVSIRFYSKHISYYKQPTPKEARGWGFDVEGRAYLTSNHRTKISFASAENDHKTATREKKIKAFIEKLMAESSITPIPRFSLEEHIKKTRKNEK